MECRSYSIYTTQWETTFWWQWW